ncbi:hypothetical protein K461DRAFT_280221 [Myriangium duriaei CBS 260.36]|uniref:Uncharacterized protein n=1 Tax=Myriangium duriaei CBS 260.36 TaxID=1168546 RepID=A0A9P4IZN3_9PEZI|nr:hypothetical protein K461DRAFT_280221 [Myriangium duriaei CBS 260.36]
MPSLSILAGSLLLAATSASANTFVKRDSWGPSVGLGPAKYTIVDTETTLYPGAMPANQAGDLWVWLGISNGTGDLIQSIVGSTPKGQSECGTAALADETWCVTSEVYGNDASGRPNQWVGDLRTIDTDYANGITFRYTLVDRNTWTWNQTMRDGKTGKLLATYAKASGPMLGWGTALECNNGCTGTVNPQYYRNSKITLDGADPNFSSTLGASQGANNTQMQTTDGGKTWTISEIYIPAMIPGGAAATVAGVAAASATTADTETAAPATTADTETTAPATTADTLTTASSLETVAATTLDSSPTAVPSTFATVASSVGPTAVIPRPSGQPHRGGNGTAAATGRHHHHHHHNGTSTVAALRAPRPSGFRPSGGNNGTAAATGRHHIPGHHGHHGHHNGTSTAALRM